MLSFVRVADPFATIISPTANEFSPVPPTLGDRVPVEILVALVYIADPFTKKPVAFTTALTVELPTARDEPFSDAVLPALIVI
jgi:hypothetical protein